MAKQTSGEVSVKAGADTIRLRLDIGAVQDLEDYYDRSILGIISDEILTLDSKVKDISVFFTALTGRDIFCEKDREEAYLIVFNIIGIIAATKAISDCVIASLRVTMAKPKGEKLDVGKRRAAPAKRKALGRRKK